MRVKSIVTSAAAAAAAAVGLALSAPVASAHFDFVPRVESGKVVTGGHDDEAGVDVGVLRVGGYDFGEVVGDPYNVGDPGFNTIGASAFAAGSQLRLRGLAVDGRFLRYWDGAGSPTFGAAPAGATLSLAGSPTRSATFADSALTYAPDSPATLLIGSFASNGALHVHLTSSVFENGQQVDGSVPEGAYLVSFDLINPNADGSASGVAGSDPLFVVYNNGLTEAQHDAAIDAAGAAYASAPAPEPGSPGLVLAAGGGLLCRRRRRCGAGV
jgi:hypothetical protein